MFLVNVDFRFKNYPWFEFFLDFILNYLIISIISVLLHP